MADFTDEDMQGMLAAIEKEQNSGKFQSQFWAIDGQKEGTFPIRIFPPSKNFNEEIFYFKRRVHWINKRPYLCLNQTLVDKNGNLHEACDCPVCKKVKQLYSIAGDDKNSDERKLAGSISAKDRYVSRVIVRGKKNEKGEDMEAYPEFWEFGKTILEALINFIKNKDQFGNFFSAKNGRDFNIVKTGKGRDAKYTGSFLSMNATPIFSDTEKLRTAKNELEKMNYEQLVEFSPEEDMIRAMNELINGEESTSTSSYSSPAMVVGEPIRKEVASAVSANINDTAGSDVDDELDDLFNQI